MHVVRKRLATGVDRWFVYAWRGGPCILKQDGARPVIGPDLQDRASQARMAQAGPNEDTIDGLISSYRRAPEYLKRAQTTKRDYDLWLDRISDRFGKAPIGAFADSRMRKPVIEWRDRWMETPRTADKAVGVLSILLGYGVHQGRLPINVAAGIRTLYRSDRSDLIWEREHMRAFARAPSPLRDAIWLAGLTGLRLGDLVRVEWGNVGAHAITVRTRKRGGRAVVPITPLLRSALERRDWREGTLLRSSRGTAWSEDGLKTAFQRAKPEGFARTFHDLRGTFATYLMRHRLTDSEIAMVMGWTARRVADIRARYVNEERTVLELSRRLSA